MALPFHALNAIKPYLRGDVLSLGYPDLMATPEQIEKLFGYKPTRFTKAHEWHKVDFQMPETFELFEHIGAKLTVVDFAKVTGKEVIADLNHPHDLGKFDLVIDPGTVEHCFNVGQAILNAANAVKVGGAIMHLSPMTMMNHGFYNICPTLYHDFYIQNGWELEMKVFPASLPVLHQTNRFDMSCDFLIRAIGKRVTDESLRYPIQTKYIKKMEEGR